MRKAFTLLELIVVIAILAILVALTVAGIGQVRSIQRTRNTEKTIIPLQQNLNNQINQVVKLASNPKNQYISDAILANNGDKEAARIMIVNAYLQINFPETFQEATSGFTFVIPKTAFSPQRMVTIPPNSRFNNIPKGFVVINAADQSAVLLYLILGDSSEAQTVVENGYTFFKDTWANPLYFSKTISPKLTVIKNKTQSDIDGNPVPIGTKLIDGSIVTGLNVKVQSNIQSMGKDGIFGNDDDIFGSNLISIK